ncbi:MAG: hypothetical protein QM811_27265 [Pirellulales bacterium]
MSSAHVKSVDAIYEFRAALLEFASDANQALDMLDVEARRGVEWLTVEQVRYWKAENRKSWDRVSECKDALHQAVTQRTIGDHIPDCIDEKKALQKAQNRLKLTERKLEAVQHWCREASHVYNEFEARFSQGKGALDGEIPSAVAAIERIARRLEEYLRTLAPAVERSTDGAEEQGTGTPMTAPLPPNWEIPDDADDQAVTADTTVQGEVSKPAGDV